MREFARIEWQEHWNCGNAIIDFEHRSIIDETNKLFNMIANDVEHAEIKTQIERIANDIHLHFKDEEKELSTVEFDLIESSPIYRNLT